MHRGANYCTLRGAITKANLTPDDDAVSVPAIRISLAGDLPQISAPLTIAGASARTTIIDGAQKVETVFFGGQSLLTLKDLAITGAKAAPANFQAGNGAVLTPLRVERVAIVDNQTFGLVARATTIVDSVIARNTGQGAGGILSAGPDVLRNSTVVDNTAVPGTDTPLVWGAGVVSIGGFLVIEHSTIARNHAAAGSAVIAAANLGALTQFTTAIAIRSSIVADGGGDNCGGGIASHGHNIDSDGSCGFAAAGDRSKVNAMLGPLANNGGPTDTVALLQGSPAIDAGGVCPATDQRGQTRLRGRTCDAGAFESLFTAALPATTNVDRTPPKLTVRGVARTMTRKAFRAGVKVRIGANEPDPRPSSHCCASRASRRSPPCSLRRAAGTRTVTLKPKHKLKGTGRVHVQLRVAAFDGAWVAPARRSASP